ncbi:hypothetical protein D3C83_36640 [compost metagenome]
MLADSPELASTISEIVASRQDILAKARARSEEAQEATKNPGKELLGRIRSFFRL